MASEEVLDSVAVMRGQAAIEVLPAWAVRVAVVAEQAVEVAAAALVVEVAVVVVAVAVVAVVGGR